MRRPVENKHKKDIIPEPVEPGGVHPELGGQVDAQWESAVHGVVKESPAARQTSVWKAPERLVKPPSPIIRSYIAFYPSNIASVYTE